MADTAEKWVPKLITFKGARLAFARISKAEPRKDRFGKPQGDPFFSATALLDPSNVEHAKTIAEIKAEAKRGLIHRFGNSIPQGIILPFGLGNDLPAQGKKLYDGFKDMFYLKLKDKSRPNTLNRAGKNVVEGEPGYPYSGCYVAGTTTLFTYDNQSKGVGANLRTLVFMSADEAFGGGGADAEQEFAALGDLGQADAAPAPAGATAGKDPWD